MGRLRCRVRRGLLFSRHLALCNPCRCCTYSWYLQLQLPTLILGGIIMKVVVIKSPKFLSGFLRMVFKIKKEEIVT